MKEIALIRSETEALIYLRAADSNGHLRARAKVWELTAAKRRAEGDAAAEIDRRLRRHERPGYIKQEPANALTSASRRDYKTPVDYA